MQVHPRRDGLARVTSPLLGDRYQPSVNGFNAIADPVERKKRFDEMVAKLYRSGKAVNSATHFGIDEVIDPADSRRWIASTLRSTPPPSARTTKKHLVMDSW